MWIKKDSAHGLSRDGLDWAQSTAAEFATAAQGNPQLLQLKREYLRYFGTPNP